MGWFDTLTKRFGAGRALEAALEADIARGIAGAELGASSRPAAYQAPTVHRWHDGTKFAGGFGTTQILDVDYWTLRARSVQLFRTNLYARGIIRRFVTNVINTGLHLEAVPEADLLEGVTDLEDWSENIETRFRLWSDAPRLCDHRATETFGKLQATAYTEALISGDVLVTLQQDRRTKLPRVRLVRGAAVQTPMTRAPRKGNTIEHGVELDKRGRQVAYWVAQDDGTSKRLPARGARSGRRVAWLVYATEKRLDDVRGEPILSLVMQSLREIDRYRDSIQRKAVINSILAMFIKKGEERFGSKPMTGGAVRHGAITDEVSGDARTFKVADFTPGLVLDELQFGEEPVAFQHNAASEGFGTFEESIIQGVAWALETPPEILRLSFSSNYSASQAAINEYKMFLNRVRADFGRTLCVPVYVEWLISSVLVGHVEASGFLAAHRDPEFATTFEAWAASDWAGQIKPAVDLSKLVKGYGELILMGAITRNRATRELTGMKFSKVVKALKAENEALAEAQESMTPEPPAGFGAAPEAKPGDDDGEKPDDDGKKPDKDDDA